MLGKVHDIFVDKSVDTGDILENQTDERIRTEIRDDYLRDSTVTIVLIGADTKRRKHVDWEIHDIRPPGSIPKAKLGRSKQRQRLDLSRAGPFACRPIMG